MKGKRLSPISPVPVSDVYRPGATGLCRITAPRKEQLQPFAGLEGPDLVPEERRELEIQIVRGRFHFTLLILDERGQVLAGPGHRLHFQLQHIFHVRQDVPDRLLYGARRDAVLPVVRELDLAAALGFPDRVPDGPGYDVRIDQHFAGHVPGRPADGLDERGLAPQKTFLVGVQDGDERNLRQIQAFPKQVHAHQDVVSAAPGPSAQAGQYPDAVQGLNVAVEIVHLHLTLFKIRGQVLGHFFGQGGHEHALLPSHALRDARDKVIHLAPGGPDGYLRVRESRRTDDLLRDALARLAFERSRRRGGVDHLPHPLPELRSFERPVVRRRGQPEAEFDERLFPGGIAFVHALYLRHGHVGFVYYRQKTLRKIIEQGVRRLARCAAGKMPGIVLDAVAISDLPDHGQVEFGPALQALRLQKLAVLLEIGEPFLELRLDLLDGARAYLRRGHEVLGGRDVYFRRLRRPPGTEALHRVYLVYLVYPAVPQLEVVDDLPVRRHYLPVVAPQAESAALKVGIRPLELQLDQLAHEALPVHGIADLEMEYALGVRRGRPQAVDAGNRSHHYHVLAGEQGGRRRVAELVYLVVHQRFFADIGIRGRQIRFRLVIIVIGNEIMHRVLGEKLPELVRELGGQGLIVRDDQGRSLERLDDVRDGEGLAGAGDPQKGLVAKSAGKPVREVRDRLGLVACRLVLGYEFEIHTR